MNTLKTDEIKNWYEMNYSQKIHLIFKVDRSSRRRQI